MNLSQEDRSLIAQIRHSLGKWHKYTIAIDGRDGTGKSRLARILALVLDMPAIETDLFLIPHQGEPVYRYKDLKRAVLTRLDLDRPVIIEGIFILEILEHIGVSHNLLIYVSNPNYESHSLASRFDAYEAQYSPRENADLHYISNKASQPLL